MSKVMVGARIPEEWATRLTEIAQIKCKSQSQVIYQAIAAYLGETVNDANSVIDEVRDLRERVVGLEEKVASLLSREASPKPYSKTVSYLPSIREAKQAELDDVDDEILTDFLEPEQPVTPQYSVAPRGEGWLTTGEAFDQLKSRGFEKSTGTLRRWLQPAITTGKLPAELEAFGLEADFTKRQRSNPKDNSVRWLRFLQPTVNK